MFPRIKKYADIAPVAPQLFADLHNVTEYI